MADGLCLSVQLRCMLTQIEEAQPQVAVVGHHLAVKLLMPSVHAQHLGAPCGLPQVHDLLKSRWYGRTGLALLLRVQGSLLDLAYCRSE